MGSFKKLFGKLVDRLEKRPIYEQFFILMPIACVLLVVVILILFNFVKEPHPPSSAPAAKQTSVTAEEAGKLTRSAAAARGKAVPIASDTDCNARISAINNDVLIFAQAGIDAVIFTYGPADVSPLPSLDGISTAFDAACVDTVSESMKSRGFGIERVEISPAEGTGHLIVSWKSAAASK